MKKDITLTQKEFTRRIAGTTGMANEEAEKIVQIIVKEITSCLLDGIGIKFRGLGKFMVSTGIYKSYYKTCSSEPQKDSNKIQIQQKIERTNEW